MGAIFDPNDPYYGKSDDEINALLGITPPEMAPAPPAPRAPSALQSLVEGFSGLEQQPQAQPRTFGEALVQGLGRGLGSAGSRSAAQREKYNAQAEQRQLARDQQNLEASRDYRKERGMLLSAHSKQVAEDQAKQKKYEQENPKPTDEQLKAAPWLARVTDENGRIPRSTLIDAVKPTKPDEPLEYTIEGVPATRKEYLAYVNAKAAQASKPPTPEQAKLGGYYEDARNAVSSVANPGGVEDRIAKSKGIGAYAINGPRQLQSEDQKAYNDAVTAFANDITYAQSGATARPDEVESTRRTYFWVPGDGNNPRILERKRKLREKKLDEIRKQGPKGGEGATPVSATVPTSWRRVE